MTERQLEERLRAALEHAAPNDVEGVLSRCAPRQGGAIPITAARASPKKHRWLPLAAAACLVLAVTGGGVGYYLQSNTVASIISLDVNPGVELTVNRQEKVLSAAPTNEDAVDILDGMELKGTPLDVAMNAIVGSLVKNGYVDELANSILITVEDEDTARGARLQQELTSQADAVLASAQVNGAILSQTFQHNDALQQKADEYGISAGKAALIQTIADSSSGLYTFEELVGLPINDLNLLMNSGKLNLGGIDRSGTPASGAYIGEEAAKRIALEHAGVAENEITEYECEMDYEHGRMVYDIEFSGSDSTNGGYIEYDYHIDAENGEILKYDFEHDDDHHATPAPGSEYITSEEAIAFALERAGLARNQVTNLKAEFETEHGIALYEVEFDANGYEYEIEVNAADGSILKFDRDYDDDHNHGGHHDDHNHGGHHENPTAAPTQAPSESYIGTERAKQIAFNRAGVSASQVKNLKVKLDTDDGRAIYEIEFDANGYEYDVDVDAVNGNVVDFDKDVIDDDDDEPKSTPAPAGDYIGAERAKKIAFNRAGISASQAEELEVELEREDGRMVYTVEFKAGGYEYEVEIDALTGEILDYDVERD